VKAGKMLQQWRNVFRFITNLYHKIWLVQKTKNQFKTIAKLEGIEDKWLSDQHCKPNK